MVKVIKKWMHWWIISHWCLVSFSSLCVLHLYLDLQCMCMKTSVKYHSWHVKAKLGASPPVCSPWDQSGWRCERGRCRCSRSRQRGELHRPSRASRARPTHGAQMHVASAGAAAVAVPGRSFSPFLSTRELTQHGRHYCTQDSTAWATVSQQQASACVLCSWYFYMWSVDSCPAAVLNMPKHQLVICCHCQRNVCRIFGSRNLTLIIFWQCRQHI